MGRKQKDQHAKYFSRYPLDILTFKNKKQKHNIMKTTINLFKRAGMIILFLWMMVQTNSASAQCTAAFVDSVAGSNVHFYNTSSSAGSAVYIWSFGDGASSYSSNPTHKYASAGTYYVCLTLFDSANNCSDTLCDSVHVTSNSGGGKCYASFQDSVIGDTVFLYGGTNSTGSYTYLWTFGDGTSSTAKNPKHKYKAFGQHLVCLIVSDKANNCSDTLCKYVSVTAPACKASYTYTIDTLKKRIYVYGSSTNTQATVTYTWDFGDNSQPVHTKNAIHDYTAIGSYIVCFTIEDSARGCFDQTCTQVNLSGPCDASFYSGSNGLDGHFGSNTFSTSRKYHWTFGDGSSTSGAYDSSTASHTYSSAGTYTVCLYVTDSANNCSDSSCQSITISTANTNYCMTGKISLGNTSAAADYARVWLIKYDTAAGTLTALDSVDVDSGGYYYLCATEGFYLIKSALLSTSSSYSNYLPTYYNDKLHWDTANLVHLNGNKQSIDIHLIAGTNTGGPGFIGGSVTQGANKTDGVGDPLAGVEVILKDASMKAIQYRYSDAQGKYSFNNLAYGTYYISPEILGKQGANYQVVINQNTPSINQVSIVVNSTYAVVSLKVADVQNNSAHTMVNIYPNPAQEILNIDMKDAKNMGGKIYIMDLSGKVIQQVSFNGIHGEVSVAQYPAGMYMMSIEMQNGDRVNTRFVKQ
jgi:PKD repeat protein